MTSENVVSGVGASPGIAIGPVIRITAVEVEVPEVESPAEVLEEAMSAASTSLEQLSAAARPPGTRMNTRNIERNTASSVWICAGMRGFLPPMQMNCAEQHIKESIEKPIQEGDGFLALCDRFSQDELPR